jgi:hypothetical protein
MSVGLVLNVAVAVGVGTLVAVAVEVTTEVRVPVAVALELSVVSLGVAVGNSPSAADTSATKSSIVTCPSRFGGGRTVRQRPRTQGDVDRDNDLVG